MSRVSLREFALLAAQRVEEVVPYLRTNGEIVQDSEDPNELASKMGTRSRAYRISYPPESMVSEPGLGRVIIWRFNLNLSLLYRKLGNSSTRLEDEGGVDVSTMAKDVVECLQGERLGILNHRGIECGPVRVLGDPGSSLQAMRMLVSGWSRESRNV